MIRIPQLWQQLIQLKDVTARVRTCSSIGASTLEEAVTDDMGVIVSIGPVSIYASAEQAEALGIALTTAAWHVRAAAEAQVAQP